MLTKHAVERAINDKRINGNSTSLFLAATDILEQRNNVFIGSNRQLDGRYLCIVLTSNEPIVLVWEPKSKIIITILEAKYNYKKLYKMWENGLTLMQMKKHLQSQIIIMEARGYTWDNPTYMENIHYLNIINKTISHKGELVK